MSGREPFGLGWAGEREHELLAAGVQAAGCLVEQRQSTLLEVPGDAADGLARWWVEMLTAASAHMPLASTAPAAHPVICAGMWASASRHDKPPKLASTSDTTGFKCAPETGPNITMITNRPAAVAA